MKRQKKVINLITDLNKLFDIKDLNQRILSRDAISQLELYEEGKEKDIANIGEEARDIKDKLRGGYIESKGINNKYPIKYFRFFVDIFKKYGDEELHIEAGQDYPVMLWIKTQLEGKNIIIRGIIAPRVDVE